MLLGCDWRSWITLETWLSRVAWVAGLYLVTWLARGRPWVTRLRWVCWFALWVPPLEVISQLLRKEAVARCIPDQEVGLEAAQLILQDQGRVGEHMLGVCHLEKINK